MKRVLITRPRHQAGSFGEAVRNAGLEPVFFPVIEISEVLDTGPLDHALKNLASYDWLILTSVNGVEALWRRFEALGIDSLPPSLRTAAIGPKTAAALEASGIRPDFVPQEYVAEAILPGLGNLHGLRVLLARADLARPDLPETIRRGGGTADEVTAYLTLPAKPDREALQALKAGVDVVTFTSPSTARNFAALVRSEGLDPLHLPGSPQIACIGPITARAAEGLGFTVDLTADEYTTEGLLAAVLVKNQKVRK